MRCVFCNHVDTTVKDSRPMVNNVIRRRRECPACNARFTTFEQAETHATTVTKRSGQGEPFDRNKLLKSMQAATKKRHVEIGRLERVIDGIERRALSNKGCTSTELANQVIAALGTIDRIAQLRYASFYPNFNELTAQGTAA